jgi:hypothetical protein
LQEHVTLWEAVERIQLEKIQRIASFADGQMMENTQLTVHMQYNFKGLLVN